LAVLKPLVDSAKDASAMTLAGEAYLASGDLAKAQAAFARAVKIDPAYNRARTALAVIEIQRGKVSEGVSELEAITTIDEGTTADMALIVTHLAGGKYDAALQALDKLEKKTKDKAFAANLRGRVFLMKKDRVAARASFEQALSLRPGYYAPAGSLAALDLDEKKPDAAAARLDLVLKADPRNVQALLAKAQLKDRIGGSEDEVAMLVDAAIKVDPSDPRPRLQLVSLYLGRGDPQKALAAAQSANAAIPDNPDLLDALGKAQLARGLPEEALSTFNRLAVSRPSSAEVQLSLARAYTAAQKDEAARQSLKQALAISPTLLVALL